MMKISLIILFIFYGFFGNAFFPNMAFWKRSIYPVFASVSSVGIGATPSNDTSQRYITVGGPGILAYKAVLITSGTCNSPGVAANLLAATEESIATSFYFTPPVNTVDDFFTVCVIGKNFVGAWQNENLPTASITLRVNTIKPVVQTLAADGGATATDSNVVQIALTANHTNLKINQFCLKSQIGTPAPADPPKNDACWKTLDGINPPILPATAITFSGFNFSIGYVQATYSIYAWAKSEAGAISSLSNTASGTIGIDKFDTTYTPPQAPEITNVLALNSDTPGSPISEADLFIPAGQSVFIKWAATDDIALPADAITISFTADEEIFNSVVSGIPNVAGAGCTIDGNATGCYRWTNGSPFSTYFKIRVGVADTTGLISYASAPPNNTTPFSIIAGNTDLGLNGSAASAIFKTRNAAGTNNTGQGRFVVRSDGNVYVLDERGLLQINPYDGLLKLYMPINGTAVNGNIATASLKNPIKMSLDASENLIIYDYDLIRKINFTTGQITTLIGGGNSNANATLASDFQINPIGSSFEYVLFTILPNGNIWFQISDDFMRSRNAGAKVRYYNAADQKVYIITPSGTGSLEDAGFDPSTYSIYNFGITFDPDTSTVTKIRSRSIIPTTGGHTPRSVSYNPTHGGVEAPHIPYVTYWADDNTFTAMSGVMYNVDHFDKQGIHRYNPLTNAWVRILGTGTKGQCLDGADALSCNTDLTDIYVSPVGQVYFMDRNRIRVIDAANKVQTLFGQSLAFGDGSKATSARLSRVLWIDRAADGRIIVADNNEFRIREFIAGGTMSLVAGNGSDSAPNTVSPAVSQPITVKYWGATYPFSVDAPTGDIFYTRNGSYLSRLTRATGLWSDIAGGGGTDYTAGDTLLGNQISISGYAQGPMGYNGSQIMRSFHQWNGTTQVNSMIKLYSTSGGTQTHFAGLLGVNVGSLDSCAVSSTLATCKAPTNFNSFSKAQWDSVNNYWLIHHIGSSIIHTAVEGGEIGNLVSLPRGAQSFYYVVKTGIPHVYYCSGGKVYKYNLNTSNETALFWPSETISCDGYSMTWDPAQNSIIFPILQNGLGGVARILDP